MGKQSVSAPTEASVAIGGKKFTIKKLPWGRYGLAFRKATSLFNRFDELTSDKKENLAMLQDFMGEAPAEVAEVLSVASGCESLTTEVILEAYPEEVAEVFEKIWELNNLQGIWNRIKKVTSPAVPQPKPTGSKTQE